YIDYPHSIPNLHFIAAILTIMAVNYYLNLRNFPVKYKYFFTAFCICLLMLVPVPFFAVDRTFGSIPTGLPDYRSYTPFLLLSYIIILFKYYSMQMSIIKDNKTAHGIMFSSLFLFVFPLYVYSYGLEGIKQKPDSDLKRYHLKKMIFFFLQFLGLYIFLIVFFGFVPVPWDAFLACFRGYWAIPMVIGSGVIVITFFCIGSAVLSFGASFYNVFGGYNFKYYQDKAFLSASVGEFWQKWNLWGNDWFGKHLYRPLRRKFNFTHSQAVLSIFTFSALVHAYIIALITPQMAWLTFFVFFINGVVVALEKQIVEKFPFFSRMPRWLKVLLTLIFLDITLGLFGFCFNKWP
ncbi:MAG: hypothetical protein AB7V50_07240, partial [Vampirovibrionia bacterium]